MVIALAGRRVDAPGADIKRFPAENAAAVAARIREFLVTHEARALVSAAACGADIIALEVAGELGLRRRVVLPFDRAAFRAMSVVDRGAAWGARYDQILDALAASGDLIEAAHDPDDGQTWFTGNLEILDQAASLATQLGADIAALIVWNGASRGADDVTGHFKSEAEARGLGVAEALTV
ncbi:MAG: hypothetical protein ACKV2V_20895 [Blastocatellia bacterium]